MNRRAAAHFYGMPAVRACVPQTCESPTYMPLPPAPKKRASLLDAKLLPAASPETLASSAKAQRPVA